MTGSGGLGVEEGVKLMSFGVEVLMMSSVKVSGAKGFLTQEIVLCRAFWASSLGFGVGWGLSAPANPVICVFLVKL